MASRLSVVLAFVVFSCASRSIDTNDPHDPANPRAVTAQLSKLPPTLQPGFDPDAEYVRTSRGSTGVHDHSAMHHGAAGSTPHDAGHGVSDAGAEIQADGAAARKSESPSKPGPHGNH